jgi:hypothetical protein
MLVYFGTSAPVTSEDVGSILVKPIPHVIQRATLSDSVGFLPMAPVSSYIHYKSPNINYGVNDVLVDAQL